MHQVEPAHLLSQSAFHSGGPEQPPQERRREVPNLYAVEVHGPAQCNIGVTRAIYVGGEHAHIVTGLHQRLAQAMHRLDWTAVAGGGEVARNYVQDSQGQCQMK